MSASSTGTFDAAATAREADELRLKAAVLKRTIAALQSETQQLYESSKNERDALELQIAQLTSQLASEGVATTPARRR